MIYTWKCQDCGATIEIKRPASQYKDHPNAGEMLHPGCDGVSFRRILTVPRAVKVMQDEGKYFKKD